MPFIAPTDAATYLRTLEDGSVRLVLTDPPFYGTVDEEWDNQWATPEEFVEWLVPILLLALPKLTGDGSLVFFAGIGKHGSHPLFDVVRGLECNGYTYRNWMTWRKRRAYGKECDYLYTREEVLWFSKSAERTEVSFHKPYTAEVRGYAGFDPKYKAHSDYKRVSNVWVDIDTAWAEEDPGTAIEGITELFRPKRKCQKPEKLMDRLVETHSDAGDLVVDPFAGWGTTVMSALKLGRRASGCEKIIADAIAAEARCVEIASAARAARQG